jgi:ubiquinone/menaquinone biosynthesis C-methylase UbiE
MTEQTPPRQEHPSTYFVQDRSNQDEMTRLRLQDQIVTAGMGGVLPEQPDPTRFQRVLDVGCGTGGWLMEAAKTYPGISLLIGVDVSAKMLAYARAQAEEQQVHDRVEFAVMDALRMLEFADEFFDLVNERFASSYLRTWDWHKFLTECLRICRPGGVIRFTEGILVESTSPALTQLGSIAIQAFYRAGHLFTNDSRSMITELPRQFARHSVENIQTKEYTLHIQAGTVHYNLFTADMAHVYRVALPFLRKWLKVPDNYDEIYQQALDEMRRPDFEAAWTLLTVWGTKSGRDTTHDFLNVP